MNNFSLKHISFLKKSLVKKKKSNAKLIKYNEIHFYFVIVTVSHFKQAGEDSACHSTSFIQLWSLRPVRLDTPDMGR